MAALSEDLAAKTFFLLEGSVPIKIALSFTFVAQSCRFSCVHTHLAPALLSFFLCILCIPNVFVHRHALLLRKGHHRIAKGQEEVRSLP